jgi:hypothetical protein
VTARHLRAVSDATAVTAPDTLGGWAADQEAQALALDELCPVCQAEPGDPCRGQISERPMKATHWQRIPKTDPATTTEETP